MSRKEERVLATVTIALGIIALYATAAGFSFSKRPISPLNQCINNLRQIDEAVQKWAMQNYKDTNAVATWNDILPYIKKPPKCPSGGTYTLSSLSQMPTCSIREHNIE